MLTGKRSWSGTPRGVSRDERRDMPPALPDHSVTQDGSLEKRIPLRAHDGTVRAYALVDAGDYESLSRWRWSLCRCGAKDYAHRVEYLGGGRDAKRQRSVRMHRQILAVDPGDPRRVDHENGNGLDNRRSNLRLGTHAQNIQNRGALNTNNKSGYRGVYQEARCGGWVARVCLNGRTHHLGTFPTAAEAGAATACFRALHMPFSAEARDEAAG